MSACRLTSFVMLLAKARPSGAQTLASSLKQHLQARHQQSQLLPPCTLQGGLCNSYRIRVGGFDNMNDPALCLSTNTIGNYGGLVGCKSGDSGANWIFESVGWQGGEELVRIWNVRSFATKDTWPTVQGYRFLLSARENGKLAPWPRLDNPGCQTWIRRRINNYIPTYAFILQSCNQYPGHLLSVRSNPTTQTYFELKPPNTGGFVQYWHLYQNQFATYSPQRG